MTRLTMDHTITLPDGRTVTLPDPAGTARYAVIRRNRFIGWTAALANTDYDARSLLSTATVGDIITL